MTSISPPSLAAILRRVGVSLLVAIVAPGVLFYVSLTTLGIRPAIVVGMTWTYAAITWRYVAGLRVSGLLLMMASVMTVRSVFTLSTGNTFVYFLQPLVTDGSLALLFLASLATARPVVARVAADFYPMDVRLAMLPRVRRLFWRLTFMWGSICLAKGLVGLWLLLSLSTEHFVLIKGLSMITMTALAIGVTVWGSTVVLRKERLLPVAV
jgi:intracellular septation protein A